MSDLADASSTGALAPDELPTRTTVRVRDGQRVPTAGLFAEKTEQIAGIGIIEGFCAFFLVRARRLSAWRSAHHALPW